MMQLHEADQLDVSRYLDQPDVLPAGKLCLEFVNTLNWHASENPVESLYTYEDLVNWAQSTGICTSASSQTLKAQAAIQPTLAQQIYAWAIELREAIYRILVAISEQRAPVDQDLALLNEALPHAFTLPEVAPTPAGFGIRWRGDDRGLDGLLWPIMRSTARLLTEGEHSRIGKCADDRGCGYLFYDTSRNRSRRWCDMTSCGNRAKSQRHYARHRHTPAYATDDPAE